MTTNDDDTTPFEIVRTAQYKKLIKRARSNPIYGKRLDARLDEIMACMAYGRALPTKYKDHALIGTGQNLRDCHVFPDLLLIYEIEPENNRYVLYALDSHSNLFK